ncbi:condensation domain-containing protein [Streptomyces lancefieldiae]|uniref:Condensation domain-containing protein n=1 Tax=Streptomyces lancefieldiae TaxID=3075520 RepID=A0ABU3ARB6_9ACTN|nr:condensation domain-containing protein [Streptomyces sp. DSM 40712]MDT0612726.1 condensation domain-containing protein [Streptomyces sp. DSM 40712]
MARPSRPRRRRGPDRRTARAAAVRVPRPTVPVTRQQYDVLLDSFAHRHTGRHVEQVLWDWRGPLDTERFISAWQSVTDREAVLRAAVDWQADPRVDPPGPRIVLHDHARADVVRHRAGTVDWEDLLERDRLRGFDLRRPAPLRLTLLDLPDDGTARPGGPLAVPPDAVPPDFALRDAAPATRVLLTFHHALLDPWSAFVLVEEFARAYLAGGVLPGGERRPDIRDRARWLERQDHAAARDFFTRAVPPGRPVLLPALPGPETRQSGCGRTEVRLSAAETGRLHHWAGTRAVPDSSVLHAVWALLLYRAAGSDGPVTVGFGVTASGRGIALDAVERLVGPMRTVLPMALRVDPAHRLERLLTTLRDRALDMAAYEWASVGQVRQWTGRTAGPELMESLVSVEAVPRPAADLRAGLSAAGIRFEGQRAGGAHTVFPLALLAHHLADGSLALSALHDRARLSDADAALLVAHCTRLLRHLPDTGESATVADVLAVLGTDRAPCAASGRRRERPVEWLRRHSTGGPSAVEGTASEP